MVILFALVTTVTQSITPTTVFKENLQILDRYATDMKTMICNSEKDRQTILLNGSLNEINDTMNYVSPPELRHRLVTINVTDGSIMQIVGNPLPEKASVITSSCLLAKGDTKVKAEVQVWY